MLDSTEIKKIEEQYGIRIVFAKIIGDRRWSFIGKPLGEYPAGETKRIKINEKFGFIIYNWHVVPDAQKTNLEKSLQKIVMNGSL